MVKEIWKYVLRGYYQVSSLGRVRRAKPGQGTFVGKMCNLHIWGGYYIVNVSVQGKSKSLYVHKLVARAFLGPCPEGKEPNHKDLVKTNNHADNFEYLTHQENVQHAAKNGALKRSLETRTKLSKIAKKRVQSGRFNLTLKDRRKAHRTLMKRIKSGEVTPHKQTLETRKKISTGLKRSYRCGRRTNGK